MQHECKSGGGGDDLHYRSEYFRPLVYSCPNPSVSLRECQKVDRGQRGESHTYSMASLNLSSKVLMSS